MHRFGFAGRSLADGRPAAASWRSAPWRARPCGHGTLTPGACDPHRCPPRAGPADWPCPRRLCTWPSPPPRPTCAAGAVLNRPEAARPGFASRRSGSSRWRYTSSLPRSGCCCPACVARDHPFLVPRHTRQGARPATPTPPPTPSPTPRWACRPWKHIWTGGSQIPALWPPPGRRWQRTHPGAAFWTPTAAA